MIATCKADSENEEACDKVKARSAMNTDPVEGTVELRQQIAKLMATLNRVREGNIPASAQKCPRQRDCGRAQMDRSTPGCPSSHNGWTSLGQTASACSTSAGHGTGTTANGNQEQNSQGAKDRQEDTANRRDPSSLQCFRCQGWGHMAWECPTPTKTLNPSGGTKGMWPNLSAGARHNSQQ